MAIANGMDVKTLSATIGHVSAITTLDIYSHRTAEMEVKLAELIERVREEIRLEKEEMKKG